MRLLGHLTSRLSRSGLFAGILKVIALDRLGLLSFDVATLHAPIVAEVWKRMVA